MSDTTLDYLKQKVDEIRQDQRDLITAISGDLKENKPGIQDDIRQMNGKLETFEKQSEDNQKEHRWFKRWIFAIFGISVLSLGLVIGLHGGTALLMQIGRFVLKFFT
jgi:hypothetical protein